MRLIQTNLRGFRQLVNRTFDFAPGMNLIYGPNEAGKSSLMEALAVLLYGVYGDGRISAADRERIEQLMPWSSADALGGTLRYQLDDGNAYHVERVFAPYQSAIVSRISDGRDITKQFKADSEGRLYVGEVHLGINKDVFENLCRVRQHELALLEQSARPISEVIMRLSSSMSADGIAVPKALDRLDAAYKQQVGTPRSSTKPYARTKKQLENLDQDIIKARAGRRSAWAVMTSVWQDENPDAEDGLTRLDLLMKKAQLAEATERLQQQERLAQRAHKLQAQVDALTEWASFRHDLYEDLVSLSASVRRLATDVSDEPPVAPDALQTLETERERLSAERDAVDQIPPETIEAYRVKHTAALEAERSADAARLHFESARADKEKADNALEAVESDAWLAELGQSGVARLQQQHETACASSERSARDFEAAAAEWKRANMTEAAFLALKDTPASASPKKGCKLIGRKDSAAGGPPTEHVIYNDLLPVYTRWKDSTVERDKARRSVEELETSIRQSLRLNGDRIDSAVFDSAAAKIERYRAAVAAQEAAARTLERAEQNLTEARARQEQAQAEMSAALPAGITDGADLDAGSQRLRVLEQELAHIDQRLAQANTELSRWQARRDEYRQALAQLRDLFREAGIDPELSLDEMMRQYRRGREQYEAWEKAVADAAAARERAQGAEAEVEQLQGWSQSLQRDVEYLASKHPDLAGLEPTETAERYQQQFDAIQTQHEQRKLQRHDQMRDAREAAERMPDLASLLERQADAARQLTALQWYGEALQMAQVELQRAASDYQRQFAPRLQALLDAGLAHATGGRYTRSQIDPETLAVHLLSPETKRWISANQLSTGTRDLVYLLLRFSIARLMSNSSERLPMLLDDPFVHCDRTRKANILDYLVAQSSDMQFLLFTQDDWTRDWLLSQYPDCNSIMMLPQNATTIDYERVQTLAAQSQEVRARLQVADDDDAEPSRTPKADAPPPPVPVQSAPVPAFTGEPDTMRTVLSSDETAIRLLRLLRRHGWQMDETAANAPDVLRGEFLSLVIDRLNERALDALGDQLVYSEDGRLVVTDEFRDMLGHWLDGEAPL